MNLDQINQAIGQMQADFDAIQMARPEFVLKNFVVGAQDTPSQAWAQCVLEMQIKYDDIRRAKIRRQILEMEISRLAASDDELNHLAAQEKQIDLEQQDRALLGAGREFEALYQLYTSFGRRWTRAELDDAQSDYWQRRLTRQANQDLLAGGHISPGNQEALRQIGAGWPGQNEQIGDTQSKFLAQGNRRLLIIVATEEKAADGLPCIEAVKIPAGVEFRAHNIFSMRVAEAYNQAGLMALREGVDWILTIEDDTFPPPDAAHRLLAHDLDIVGGWYPKRQSPREGVPLVLRDGRRQALADDGQMHEVYTIPNGCTLIKTDVFRRLQFPWFVTTPQLSQDSYFSQLAREAGYKLWCDTSIRCRHVDRETGVEYV